MQLGISAGSRETQNGVRISGNLRKLYHTVIPAKAGIQSVVFLDSRLRGNDKEQYITFAPLRVSREAIPQRLLTEGPCYGKM